MCGSRYRRSTSNQRLVSLTPGKEVTSLPLLDSKNIEERCGRMSSSKNLLHVITVNVLYGVLAVPLSLPYIDMLPDPESA